MKRAKHNLSHYKLATCNMGQAIPISCVPVLPGDTVQHATSAMIRLSPLNTPVMHPTSVRVHHFFVPNRITWPESEDGGWEQFITGGPNGDNAEAIPSFNLPNSDGTNKIIDYLYGAYRDGSGSFGVSELPLRAFNKIINEYYRDQDLVTARLENDTTVPRIAWEKDYFGVARPWTQKGPDVSLPIGNADVYYNDDGIGNSLTVKNSDTGMDHEMVVNGNVQPGAETVSKELFAQFDSGSALSVNDFRTAFSVQRYQEARARYGSRFTEYLRYLGIRPSDARLQRPEYLGGGTSRVNFSEVLQTTPQDDSGEPDPQRGIGVGDMYGHGIAGVRSNRYRKFFEEHGYVISIMSARPKAIYVNGIPREFLKRTKEDFFQKELANLGQQEVYQGELYAADGTHLNVWGFTDRYEEYRRQQSQVHGDFRTTLDGYHMGRDLAADVALNASFIECDPTDRIFQIGEDVADTLWCFINHKMVARRMVPKRANPRIL
ncbi:major capsid protein [Microviridae sp.]|nr:major capsid protein [Microviridae sp.]